MPEASARRYPAHRARGAGRRKPGVVPAGVVAPGPRCGTGPDRAARAAGDGVRRAGWPAADHRAVHDHPVSHRLRGLRALPGPGAGSGLVAGTDDRGDGHPVGCRAGRSGAGRCLRLVAGVDGGRDHPARRGLQARVRGRAPVQADADRVHERPGADHRGGPAAEALRLLGRRRWPDRRGGRVRASGCRRRHRGRGPDGRRGVPGPDSGLPACTPPRSGRPGCRGARHRGCEPVRPAGPRRDRGGTDAGGRSAVHGSYRSARGPVAARRRSAGNRVGVVDRHDLDGVGVRRPSRGGG